MIVNIARNIYVLNIDKENKPKKWSFASQSPNPIESCEIKN